MPLLTTVVDDKSPLISYDETWLYGTSTDDPLASDYYLGTFTTNNVTGGLATFDFNGSAVWIYGAKRTNHGSYTVQVDNATYSNLNGDSTNNIFQQLLFNTSLSQGMHTVRLTNTASNSLYVDIDMIVWQSEVGNADDQFVAQIAQDSDSRFQYQEPGWVTTSGASSVDLNLFNNGSGHITQTYNASVTFTFTGSSSPSNPSSVLMYPTGHVDCSRHRSEFLIDSSAEAVSLFGISGPSNGPYSVQLDGGQVVNYNASNVYPTNYGITIYHADNLGPGSHQIVLTNLPAQSGQSLAIDYAQLWTTASDVTSQTSIVNTSRYDKLAADFALSPLSPGAIAGISVAAVVAVLSAGAALFFYLRWKAALAGQQDLYRAYTLQQRLPEPTTASPTGLSSSLETSMLQNDTIMHTLSGRTQQLANNRAPQYNGTVQPSSITRDSRSIMDTVSLPAHSPVDDSFGRRPLPEAPGGGLSLTNEFPKLAGVRRGQSVMPTDRSSVATSEAPPNYTQATGNVAPSGRG